MRADSVAQKLRARAARYKAFADECERIAARREWDALTERERERVAARYGEFCAEVGCSDPKTDREVKAQFAALGMTDKRLVMCYAPTALAQRKPVNA